MKLFPSRLALALMAGLLSHSVFAAPVATVNGKVIPAERAAAMLAEQVAQGAPDSPELKDAIREELVRREILAQEATKAKLDNKDEVKAQMDLARQAVLIRAYIQHYMETHPVSDAAVAAEYESIKSRMSGKEYKPRHILVEDETAAKALIARLNAGESFAELAKQSIDPGSRDNGGDLGWSNPEMFVAPFAEALRGLEKGKFTKTPVKSDFGYHIIQLDDLRDMQPPPLEEIKPQLQQRMQQQQVEKHLQELRTAATVK